MTMFRFIVIYFVLHSISPTDQNKYDFIVIPLHNVIHDTEDRLKDLRIRPMFRHFVKHNNFANNHNFGSQDDFINHDFDNHENVYKLDIGHYDEATEMIDIDNFDYNNDREELESDGENDPLNKIVGGLEVEINLYPYHAAYGSNCGGAIIDKNWVVTAGHCGRKPYVRVGSKYLNQGIKVAVKKNYIHPLWSVKKKEHPFDYDFQLLELAEPLTFGDNVQPIKIAHIEDMVIGKVVTVTGWGNTEENGPYSNTLRAVRVPIISKENCQLVPYPYFRGALTSRMFCAGFSEGKKDACQGDSGGPAVAYDRLLGTVSFGYGCATPGSYGVYSKIAKVRDWIEETTRLTLD